jgi:hypothetical protein
MNEPIFDKSGICTIVGLFGRSFTMHTTTWNGHILKDRTRRHLRGQFRKVVDTLKNPDYILRSPSEKNVVSYVKKFNDLYLLNTVTAIAYLYVVVNISNNNIRTVYDNPALKNWKRIWLKK